MAAEQKEILRNGVFITFSGNCKKALKHYQRCFGGVLHFETFEEEMEGFADKPVIMGALVADSIVIHGSDLVHEEGRKIGNYVSVFLLFKNAAERREVIRKMHPAIVNPHAEEEEGQQLVEITDAFDVRWVLCI